MTEILEMTTPEMGMPPRPENPAVDEVMLVLELGRHDQKGLKAIAHLHLVNDEEHDGGEDEPITYIGRAEREKIHYEVDEFLDEVNARWYYLMADRFAPNAVNLIPDSDLLLMAIVGDGIPMPVGATTRYETLLDNLMAMAAPGENVKELIATTIASIRASGQALTAQPAPPVSPTAPAGEPEPQQ